MMNRVSFSLVLGVIVALFAVVATPALAFTTIADESARLSGDVCHEGDVYIAGSDVVIDQEVCGDVFAAGQTITIEKPVHGSLFAAGQTVTVDGMVDGDIRAAGETLTIEQSVGGDVFVAGNRLTVRDDVVISGDVRYGAGTALLQGIFGKKVKGASSSVALDGQFEGDVVAILDAANLSIGNDAVLQKDLEYRAPAEISGIPTDKVMGNVRFVEQKKSESQMRERSHVASFFMKWVRRAIAFYVVSLLVVWIWKKAPERIMALAKEGRGATFAWGLLFSVVTPIIALLLMVTIVLIPVGLTVFGLYLVAMYLTSIVAILWAQKKWLGEMHRALGLLIASVALALVLAVPVLGALVMIVVSWFGIGIMYLYVRERSHRQEGGRMPVKK